MEIAYSLPFPNTWICATTSLMALKLYAKRLGT
jgi:hypothetical protein